MLCDQCDATVINGMMCHEYGCPNNRRDPHCVQCNADLIPMTRGQLFCDDVCKQKYYQNEIEEDGPTRPYADVRKDLGLEEPEDDDG